MNNIDYTLYNLPIMLTRNNSKEWRENQIRKATVLLRFLKDNQLLINIDPFNQNGELKLDTIIKLSNVTEDGDKFFLNVVDGWFKYLDKSIQSNKYENISRLEKGLAKIRAEKTSKE